MFRERHAMLFGTRAVLMLRSFSYTLVRSFTSVPQILLST